MANYQKHSRAAVGHLGKHYERGKDETSEYIKYGNQAIKPELTPLNYNLAPDRNQVEYIKQRTSEVYCLNRKDVNVMCSWAVTLPKDFPKEQQREFFEQSYKFLENRYGGEKNVVSAYVHMDENQPHIHFAFVPVVKDKKKGHEKVSAKECVHKRELQTFHTDFSRHLERYFGRDVGVLNEATKEGNKSVEELKRQSATERLNEAKEQAREIITHTHVKATEIANKALEHVEKVQELVKPLENKKKALERQINALEEKLEIKANHDLTIGNIESLSGKKAFMGDKVTLSSGELQFLKDTAIEGVKLKSQNEQLKYTNERYKTLYDNMNEKFDPILKENGNLKMALRDKTQEFKKLQGRVELLGNFIKEHGLADRFNEWVKKVQAKVKSMSKDWGMER